MMETAASKLRGDLRQAGEKKKRPGAKRRLPPPSLTSPFSFKDPARPIEGWHHEGWSAQGDLSHLHSTSRHHSANESRTGGAVFPPPLSNSSSPPPAATGSPPSSDQPTTISTRRTWAAKGLLEFADGRAALTSGTLSGVAPQQPEQLARADHAKRQAMASAGSEALGAVSHSEALVVLPSSTTESKVAKKSREHRRKQAHKERERAETESARARRASRPRAKPSLVSDQACHNSGPVVATKAVLVTALMRETGKVWLTPGDGVATASENLASPPGTVPKREARKLRSHHRDWRNRDCQGAAISWRCWGAAPRT